MAVVKFEWNPAKAAANLQKHVVSFEDAKRALADPYAIVEPDNSEPSEERWRTTGMAANNILFVVTTDPDVRTVRIISARRATRREQTRYLRQAQA